MPDLLPWLPSVGVLGTLIYTVWSNRTKATSDAVSKLERRIDDLEDRTSRIEERMEHMPNSSTASELRVQLVELSGKIETLTERIKPVSAMASRIHEALIEKVSSSL